MLTLDTRDVGPSPDRERSRFFRATRRMGSAMYDVWAMRRTNVYLDERQLDLLRMLAASRGASVAELVREAVDAWLDEQGVRRVDEDEWGRRFDALLRRRDQIARKRGFDPDEVERDVMDAVREVREARAARRR